MIVLPDKQALLLKVQDPERILTVIPTAKASIQDGVSLVAVPHRLDEVRVLRNLGIPAPSPIKYYYKWPGRTPFQAQRDTAEFLTLQNNAFVLNELGTGKSLSALWAYDYLREMGIARKAMIVASLSTLERTWADEIFRNFPHLTFAVLHGSREKRFKLLEQDVDIYIINHDGVKVTGFIAAMAERKDIDVIVIDEIAQVARNSGTRRWKTLNVVCNKQTPRRVWGMTGKPTPNAPTDAWAQVRLLNPSTVPPFFNKFRDMVMFQKSRFTWVARKTAMETVYNVMQPSIRFTRDQCVDLPPCIYQTRHAELTPEQETAYKQMLRNLRTLVGTDEIRAFNEAVKLGKLLQIACGVAYAGDGSEISLPCQTRIDTLFEIIEEAESKVIVFVPYVASAKYVHAEISKRYPAELVYGDVSKTERDRIFRAVQTDPDLKVLVAQPAAMAHGLTLTEASTIVWYSATTSNEIYEQANGRITRPGQIRTQFIINIEGCATERKLYERLRNKQALQGLLLELVESTDHQLLAA